MPELHRVTQLEADIVQDIVEHNFNNGYLRATYPAYLGMGNRSVVVRLSDSKVLAISYSERFASDGYFADPLNAKIQVYHQRIAHKFFPDNFPYFHAGKSGYVDKQGKLVFGYTIRERIDLASNRWLPQDYHLPAVGEELGIFLDSDVLIRKIQNRLFILNSFGIPLGVDQMSYNFSGSIYSDVLEDVYPVIQGYYLREKLKWWDEGQIVELMNYMGRFGLDDKRQVLQWAKRAKYLNLIKMSIGWMDFNKVVEDCSEEDFDPKSMIAYVRNNFDRLCGYLKVTDVDFKENEAEKYIALTYRNRRALWELEKAKV